MAKRQNKRLLCYRECSVVRMTLIVFLFGLMIGIPSSCQDNDNANRSDKDAEHNFHLQVAELFKKRLSKISSTDRRERHEKAISLLSDHGRSEEVILVDAYVRKPDDRIISHISISDCFSLKWLMVDESNRVEYIAYSQEGEEGDMGEILFGMRQYYSLFGCTEMTLKAYTWSFNLKCYGQEGVLNDRLIKHSTSPQSEGWNTLLVSVSEFENLVQARGRLVLLDKNRKILDSLALVTSVRRGQTSNYK